MSNLFIIFKFCKESLIKYIQGLSYRVRETSICLETALGKCFVDRRLKFSFSRVLVSSCLNEPLNDSLML